MEELAETIKRTKDKRTAALMSFDIGIAEGGARTHDLEVDLFAVVRATRSTDWATPARVMIDDDGVGCSQYYSNC
jgi:hypothetical protein